MADLYRNLDDASQGLEPRDSLEGKSADPTPNQVGEASKVTPSQALSYIKDGFICLNIPGATILGGLPYLILTGGNLVRLFAPLERK